MKSSVISENLFSYKENLSLRFSEKNYLLVVKDEDYPGRNVIPILYYDNGNIESIDTYDMEKIMATPNNKMDLPPISERFSFKELLRVSFGYIISNDRWHEGSSYPKCLTFHTNIQEINYNEIIEIFEGEIDEAKGRVKLSKAILESLIIDVYLNKSIPFFIESNSKIIGPFKAIKKDSEGFFIVEKDLWVQFGEYEYNEQSFIKFDVNQTVRKVFIKNFNKLILKKEIDFKTDFDLIEEFKKKIIDTEGFLDESLQNNILQLLKRTAKLKSIDSYLEKNARIKKLVLKSEKFIISNIDLANVIPEISNLNSEIDKLKDEKFHSEKEIRLLNENKNKIISEIEENKNEKLSLEEEIENITRTKEKKLQSVKLDLELEINKLEVKKQDLEKTIKTESSEKSKYLIDLKSEIKVREEDKKELEGVVKELRKQNKNAQLEAQSQLIELFKHKKHFDFLSGRDLSEFENEKAEEFINYEIDDSELHANYEDFREKVSTILKKSGRSLDNHFIDNLLISIHQNTLTIFAGLPGTGKTSLARILTQILSPKARVQEVSVNRGWSSQKDFIGFQNPLTNKFHASNTGVYKILNQLDFECRNEKYFKSPLSYIILDEANLSPIEHYWSTFYNLTDTYSNSGRMLKIDLGQSEKLEYANNLRFIATINYDQTTEGLSPRVIDRANIIQIKSDALKIEEITNEEFEDLRLSYEKCKEFFHLLDFTQNKVSFPLADDLEEIFNEIKILLKELRLPISPRVELAIKRFCNTAKDWMRENSRPLDYCIAQRILPMINLQGDNSKFKLIKLLDLFKKHDLKVSFDILHKIIECGEEDSLYEGNFNYFLTLSYA